MTYDELLASFMRSRAYQCEIYRGGFADCATQNTKPCYSCKLHTTIIGVVELHKPDTRENYRSDKPQCSYCRSLCHSYSGLNCNDEGDGLWPCATIQYIEKELT